MELKLLKYSDTYNLIVVKFQMIENNNGQKGLIESKNRNNHHIVKNSEYLR